MRARSRYAYGAVSKGVSEYIADLAVGTEFRIADVADDLDALKTTVSAAVLKMARGEDPVITLGTKSGFYRKIRQVDAEPPAPSKPAARPPAPRNPRTGQLMEVIGVFKDGSVLMRATDDTLWKAEQQ